LNRNLLYCLTLLFLLNGCANVVAPTGGPKDTTPPKILKTIPQPFTVNFNSKTVNFFFNEYVDLKEISNKLIVSPPLKHPPEFIMKGKSFTMKLNDTLLLNTTYTFNFTDAIHDITENNILDGFQYVVSTGDYVDSLSIKGNVKTAFDQKTEKGELVMLYDQDIDSLPYKEIPLYLSKTNDAGDYFIKNIREGRYKVFALKDGNSNYLYDAADEMIGFVDSLVEPGYTYPVKKVDSTMVKDSLNPKPQTSNPKPETSISTAKAKALNDSLNIYFEDSLHKNTSPIINIRLFTELPAKQHFKKVLHEQYGKVTLAFAIPLVHPSFKSLNSIIDTNNYVEEYSLNRDTLTLWLRNVSGDSLIMEVSDGEVILDTIQIALRKKNWGGASGDSSMIPGVVKSGKEVSHKGNPKAPVKLELKIQSNVEQGGAFDVNKDILLTTSQPVVKHDFSGIILKQDSDTLVFKIVPTDSLIRNFKLSYKWKEEKNYSLLIPPGTFTDMYGLSNDTMKVSFKTKPLKYGNLLVKLNIAATKGNYILQLLDEKENVILKKEIKGKKDVMFDYLEAKTYRLKLIYDENNNHKWDTGNYLAKKQPEKVIYYPETINVRSNWDMELEWMLK